jgi:fermentation-respiration switch protein FrsA (DUF1100 family)
MPPIKKLSDPAMVVPKTSWWKRSCKFIALRLAFWYAVICLVIMGMQRHLIYHPQRTEPITATEAGLPEGCVHDFSFETADGLTLHGWHLPRKGIICLSPEETQRALADSPWLVLFFHGNAGDRRGRMDYYHILTEAGADVFALDYRGYADNPGSPKEAGLTEDARGLWKYATETRAVDPARIVLFGESLGGGVAVRLAQEACQAGTPPAGLILRSTFSSLADAAWNRYPWLPVRLLLWDRYPSGDRIGDVTSSVLVLHGTQDRIVPCELGERLFAAAPPCSAGNIPKRFVALEGADHNGMLLSHQREFAQAIDEFFAELTPPGTGNSEEE